jgi:predicted regulator of Ras-like GTPase activity (Roadblock/LC7/MglB family)
MADVSKILDSLCSVEGVKGAFLVDKEGQLKNNSQQEDVEVEVVTRLISNCLESGNSIVHTLEGNSLKECIIEYTDSNLTLDVLKDGSTLALLASSGANLGRIRLEIRKTKKEIENLIA